MPQKSRLSSDFMPPVVASHDFQYQKAKLFLITATESVT